jgi:FMN reductase
MRIVVDHEHRLAPKMGRGDPAAVRVLAVDGSPTGPGRTGAVLGEILAGARSAGARASTVALVDEAGALALEPALAAIARADALAFGSPVYRASFAWPLKALLDHLPRGMWGETEAPITARATAIALTGATWHHYLALDGLRDVLAGFFAAHVLAPGLYVPADGFDARRRPVAAVVEQARAQGRALVELAAAIAGSPALASVRPQA